MPTLRRMPKPFKIDETLSTLELERLEGWVRERRRTVDEVFEFVQAEFGYTGGRSSIGTWMGRFNERLMTERFSRSGELARAIKGAVNGGEFGDVADAALMQLTQVVFEQSARLEADGELDPLDVQRMTKSLANLTATKIGLVKVLAEKFDKESKGLLDQRRAITAEDIAQVRKAVFG